MSSAGRIEFFIFFVINHRIKTLTIFEDRLLQESGTDGLQPRPRPALVDVSVQSDINFDETHLATDFCIDPFDQDDDITCRTRNVVQERQCISQGLRSTTLSQFSWRDGSKGRLQDAGHAVANNSSDSQFKGERRQQAPWPLILHQSFSMGPEQPASTQQDFADHVQRNPLTISEDSADAAVDAHQQAWDESFLLGVMQRAAAAAAPHSSPAQTSGQSPGQASMPPLAPASEWPALILSTPRLAEPVSRGPYQPAISQLAGRGPGCAAPRASAVTLDSASPALFMVAALSPAAGRAPSHAAADDAGPPDQGSACQWPTLVASSVVSDPALQACVHAAPAPDFRRIML